MRVVVFSDSHNNFHALHRVVEAQPKAVAFLHLGDGEREFDDLRDIYPDKQLLSVRGNCDWGSVAKTEDIFVCGENRILFTHGHMYDVKRDLNPLTARAKKMSANIACFGHTHVPLNTFADGIYLLNPGSVSVPRRSRPTYGIIDLTGAGIAINIACL